MGIGYYLIKHFGLPLTYAYATLRQSVAGNSTFQGIVYCNLGTPKTVISNFATTRQIETPYSSPCKYDYPNNVPLEQKNSRRQKTTSTQMYWSGCKLILLVGRMVDFLEIKTPCFCHSLETQTGIGAMSTPDGSLMEPRRNMAKSMAG